MTAHNLSCCTCCVVSGDDTCRVGECGDDGGDCLEERQCAEGGICRQIFRFWRFLGDGFKWNTTYFCEDKWPIFNRVAGVPDFVCEHYMNEFDYNEDNAMNGRELTALGYNAMRNPYWFYGSSDSRAPQIRCESCWGTEVYNV